MQAFNALRMWYDRFAFDTSTACVLTYNLLYYKFDSYFVAPDASFDDASLLPQTDGMSFQ